MSTKQQTSADAGTFKSPLHARFDELQKTWLNIKEKSSNRKEVVSTSCGSDSRIRGYEYEGYFEIRSVKSCLLENSPDRKARLNQLYLPSSASSFSSHFSRQSKEFSNESVFERLYTYGKTKVQAARERDSLSNSSKSRSTFRTSGAGIGRISSDGRLFESPKSGDESTVSTISTTNSARRQSLEKLFDLRPRPQPLVSWKSPSKYAFSMDRRVKNLGRVIEEILPSDLHSFSNLSVSSTPSPMEHLLRQSIDENLNAIAPTSPDDTYNRFYSKGKKSRSSLLSQYNSPPTKPFRNSDMGLSFKRTDETTMQQVNSISNSRGDHALDMAHSIYSAQLSITDTRTMGDSFYSVSSNAPTFVNESTYSDESLLAEPCNLKDTFDLPGTDANMSAKKYCRNVMSSENFALSNDSLNVSLMNDPNLTLQSNVDWLRSNCSARKIQRAYRERKFRPDKYDSYRAAVVIQNTWRKYHKDLIFISSTLKGWRIKCEAINCNLRTSSLSLRMELECLRKFNWRVSNKSYKSKITLQSNGLFIELSTVKQLDFKPKGIQSFAVNLKCSARNLTEKENQWSLNTMAALVVRATLLKIMKDISHRLKIRSVLMIQSWIRDVFSRGKTSSSVSCKTPFFIHTTMPCRRHHNAAMAIQREWRRHRAQVNFISPHLKSWRTDIALQNLSSGSKLKRMKAGLLVLSKAIGQVGFCWLGDEIIFNGNEIAITWQRDIKVFYGLCKQVWCPLRMTCEATWHNCFGAWNQQKLGMLLVKATLKQALDQDTETYNSYSTALIQKWWRMILVRHLDSKINHSYSSEINEIILASEPHLTSRPYDTIQIRSALIIQKFLRSVVLVREECSIPFDFQMAPKSDLTIQSDIFSTVDPEEFHSKHGSLDDKKTAAIVIQSFLRMSSKVNQFQNLLIHILKIQRFIRAYLIRKSTKVPEFEKMKDTGCLFRVQQLTEQSKPCHLEMNMVHPTNDISSVFNILHQKSYKGEMLYPSIDINLVLIQKHVRGFVQRRVFLRKKNAVLLLQRCFRKFLVYSDERRDCTVLRRHACGFHLGEIRLLQDNLIHQTKCAILIQSFIRGSLRRKEYRSKKGHARILNRFIRTVLLQNRLRSMRNFLLSPCVPQKIESLVQHHARAKLIQARHRGFLQRRLFIKKRQSVLILQRGIRNHLKVKSEAAQKIQKTWRIYYCYKLNQRKKMDRAFTLIQSYIRCHIRKRTFLNQRRIAVTFQRLFRSKLIRDRFKQELVATQRIQTTCREFLSRQKLRLIQELQIHRIVAIQLIQARYRGWVQRRLFLKKKSCIVLIQRVLRGQLVRNRVSYKFAAALTMQRIWRSYYRCQEFLREKKRTAGVVLMQSLVRRNWKRRAFLQQRRIAVTFQRLFRCTLIRNRFKQELVATQRIQAAWREFLSRQKLRLIQELQVRRTVAIQLIQARYRGWVQRRLFLKEKDCIVLIQRVFRGGAVRRVSREMLILVKKVQRGWRKYALNRKLLLEQKCSLIRESSATFLQSRCRGFLQRRRLIRKKRSVVVIQVFFRSVVVGVIKKTFAAIMIERAWRNRKRAIQLSRFILAVSQLQSMFRRYQMRKRSAVLYERATKLQCAWRTYCSRCKYTAKLAVVVTLQKNLKMRSARMLYLKQKRSAIVIQGLYCAWKLNMTLLDVKSSIILLKRSIRGQLQRSATRFALIHLRTSGLIIKRLLLMKVFFKSPIKNSWMDVENSLQLCAAVIIQSAIRRYIAIVYMTKVLRNSNYPYLDVTIGSRWRAKFFRHDYFVTVIQRTYRGFKDRKHLEKLEYAITLVQARYRCYRDRNNFIRFRSAIVKLQIFTRISFDMKIAARNFNFGCNDLVRKDMHRSATIIQACFRRYICQLQFLPQENKMLTCEEKSRRKRNTILSGEMVNSFHSYYKPQETGEACRSITILQSLFRGNSCRRRLFRLSNKVRILQRVFRQYRQQNIEKNRLRSTKVLQRFYRLYKAHRVIANYGELRNSNYTWTEHRSANKIQVAFKRFSFKAINEKSTNSVSSMLSSLQEDLSLSDVEIENATAQKRTTVAEDLEIYSVVSKQILKEIEEQTKDRVEKLSLRLRTVSILSTACRCHENVRNTVIYK